jgi:hypothetical protein
MSKLFNENLSIGGVLQSGAHKMSEAIKKKDDIDTDMTIMTFLSNNNKVDKDNIEQLAAAINLPIDGFYLHMYKLLTDMFFTGGKVDMEKLDKEQLEKGGADEASEHFNGNFVMGLKTAADHLVKIPNYYSKLENMEKKNGR